MRERSSPLHVGLGNDRVERTVPCPTTAGQIHLQTLGAPIWLTNFRHSFRLAYDPFCAVAARLMTRLRPARSSMCCAARPSAFSIRAVVSCTAPPRDTSATEDSPLHLLVMVHLRNPLEADILDAAADLIHGIIRRSGWVYGNQAWTAMRMYGSTQEHGAARYVGNGQSRCTCVHVDDLADLDCSRLRRRPQPRSAKRSR